MQRTFFGGAKTIAGTILIGVGTYIFYENLDRAGTQLSHLLGNAPGPAIGVLPTVILGWRILQVYAADHQAFIHGFLQHVWVSCSPLLLVIAGMVLSRDALSNNFRAVQQDKKPGHVDLAGVRSTLK